MNQSKFSFVTKFLAIASLVLGAFQTDARELTATSIRGVPGFENPENLLQQLVRAKRGGHTNTFCVIGQKDSLGRVTAWIHWVNRGALIWWEPSRPPMPLAQSRRYLSLTKDVVESEEMLQGSTYLVTRTWVNQLISNCAKTGDKFTIRNGMRRKFK